MKMEEVYQYIDNNMEKSVQDLQELLRIPSVAAKNQCLDEGAECVIRLMKQAGIEDARGISVNDGPQVVIGSVIVNEKYKTLLCYGHYDVQPAEPFEEWISPPFDANIIDGKIIARGATDDKSGVMAFIKAYEAFRAVYGEPPVNLKFIFEGEEEIGSPHLDDFMIQYGDLLKADGMHCLDGGVNASKVTPEIDLGLKGILYIELIAHGANRDNYSGNAAMLDNPAWELVHALASIKDKDGKIIIDGWYDDFIEPDETDIDLIRTICEETDEKDLLENLGVDHFANHKSMFEVLCERYYGATATINGLVSGYTGEGSKTIVPASAMAKIDFRLPAGFDDLRQLERLKTHLAKHGFGDLEVRSLAGRGYPYKVPVSEPLSQAIIAASNEIFGIAPIVHGMTQEDIIKHHLGMPVVLTGFGPADCNLHAPNEYMSLDYYQRGIKFAASIMNRYADYNDK